MLRIRHLSKQFDEFRLQDINLAIEQGDYFVLLGPSGAGKTLLFETVAGINVPDEGSILLKGNDITRSRIRNRRIGLVFQDGALFPHLTVAQNIGYPLKMKKATKTEIRERVNHLAGQVGIGHLLHRKPGMLSGGEQKRIAIARVLALEPVCLLLDEPLSSIDSQLTDDILLLLKKLNRNGLTILHITHDYREAFSQAGKMAVIDDGRIIQQGAPIDIMARPASKFIARFIGIRNYFNFLRTDENRVVIQKKLELNLPGHIPEKGHIIIPGESVKIVEPATNIHDQAVFTGIIENVVRLPDQVELVVDIGIILHFVVSPEYENRLLCGEQVKLAIDVSQIRIQ